MMFVLKTDVSFGDCDPAGIMFYPNFFSLIDRTFHAFLRKHAGGHDEICQKIGAIGLGLMGCDARFRMPAFDGDQLAVQLHDITWEDRSFRLSYVIVNGDRTVLEATETRGVFVDDNGRLRAGSTEPLRERLKPVKEVI